ncbi:YacL family protein [Ferrimonas marina]|uniref:Uncharacterized protein n=1 Tax=Ferrimonas marina TaxID=299255 RepID=A0A1M5ZPN5_9GAMM|nr:YacL family protein [Ferrimonas marina]SHI26118.1 hypothetical protein SAMN02745129_0440 [Ferrimonas marina]
MEFEFRRDIQGSPSAQLSMGHEALGRFLTEELQQPATIQLVLSGLSQVQQGQQPRYQLQGSEQTLLLESDEALVEDHHLEHDRAAAEELEFALYDAEAMASCGLDDFENLLKQWLLFLQGH